MEKLWVAKLLWGGFNVLASVDGNVDVKDLLLADIYIYISFTLSLSRGVDQGIEPCVAHVDPQSPAFRAGLTRGLKIEKVNIHYHSIA